MAENKDSDVVELIFAVDLNPKDPEQPINVELEDWKKLCVQLLDADEDISYDEAAKRVASHLSGEVKPDEEEDAFTMHRDMRSRSDTDAWGREREPKPTGMRAAFDRALGKEPIADDEEEDQR